MGRVVIVRMRIAIYKKKYLNKIKSGKLRLNVKPYNKVMKDIVFIIIRYISY